MTPADEVKRNAAHTSDPDRVYSVVNNQTAIGGIEEVSTSWRRCLSEHGVDPSSNELPRILTDYELKEFRGPVEDFCRCRRNRPSSIRSRTSGSSCATTGSRTASSNPTTTFSTTAASPGTSSSTCPGKSSPSEQESGPIGRDQRDLV